MNLTFAQPDSAMLAKIMAWHADEDLTMWVGAGKGAPGVALARQTLFQLAVNPPPGARFLVALADDEPVAHVVFSNISDLHRTGEVHLTVDPRRHRQGIGGEVLRLALERAFESGLYRIEFNPIQGNRAAIALAESVGFILEAIMKSSIWILGSGPRNQALYRITRPEWERLQQRKAS
jgi:RimJ/RimL family protein N-acetyltransferase